MHSPLLQLSKTYQESVDHIVSDQLMIDHQWAMACRELEEVIQLGLGLFKMAEQIDARWRDGIRRSDAGFSLEQGRELKIAFDQMLESRMKVLGLIETFEKEGYQVDGATQLSNTAPLPFEDRVLDVPFSNQDLSKLAAAPGSPDPVSNADDDL